MNILVCIKQVPDTGIVFDMRADQTGIPANQIEYVSNPYDEYALEEALLLKDKDSNVNITVFTAGPPSCRPAITNALAVGADRGVFVHTSEDRSYDSFFNANLVRDAIENTKTAFDLVLCGVQGADFNNGQFPVYLAQKLNVPLVSNIFSMGVQSDYKIVQAIRLNADGSQTVYDVKLPAVLSFSKGKNPLRYAGLPGIIKARTKEIIEIIPDKASELKHRSPFQLKELYQSEHERDNILITDTDGTAVSLLYKYLANNLKAFYS